MLKVDNISIATLDKKIIENLSFSVPRGEIHVIMGPNGAGKSTILKAILGHKDYKITKGKITYNNEDITHMKTDEIAKRGIFLLEQNPTEIQGVTNAEMLRAALGDRDIKESIFEFNKRLENACNLLEIDKSFIHHDINFSMSGGEKKKNELLGIEVLRPSLLLLDELDSGLDVDALKSIALGLNKYCKETKAAMLIITHHTNILEYLTPDKVYILGDGHIVMEGDENLARTVEKNGFKGAFNVGNEEYHE